MALTVALARTIGQRLAQPGIADGSSSAGVTQLAARDCRAISPDAVRTSGAFRIGLATDRLHARHGEGIAYLAARTIRILAALPLVHALRGQALLIGRAIGVGPALAGHRALAVAAGHQWSAIRVGRAGRRLDWPSILADVVAATLVCRAIGVHLAFGLGHASAGLADPARGTIGVFLALRGRDDRTSAEEAALARRAIRIALATRLILADPTDTLQIVVHAIEVRLAANRWAA